MSGIALAVGLCVAGLVLLLAVSMRRRRDRQSLQAGSTQSVVRGPETADSLFGFAPGEAIRFQQSARAQMQREQEQWGRDYMPGVSDGVLPGRIAGIPRTLRVRR